MADQQIRQLLMPLNGAAAPNDAFSDALFERLAPIAVAAGRRDRTWYGRIVMAVRAAARPRSSLTVPQLRTAILLATLLALLIALAAIIGSRARDPNRIVLGSEAVYRDPPAFDLVVGYGDGGIRRFRYDGDAMLRADVVRGTYLSRPEGTWFLVDVRRGRLIEWDPVGETATIERTPAGMRPIALLDMRWGAEFQRSNRVNSKCLDWEYIEETVVIGRAVHHVRCIAGHHEEYWVDVVTGFVLRSTDVPTDTDRVWLTGEARSLEIGGAVDVTAFVFGDEVPRSGARMPGGDAPLEAGVRLVTSRFAPAFVVTPGDAWRSWGTDRDVVGFVRGPDGGSGPDGAAVWVVRLGVVTDVTTGLDVPLAPGVDAALAWLRDHPYVEVGEVETTTIGARPAVTLDYREVVPDDFESTCPEASDGEQPPACRRWFATGQGYWMFEATPPAAQQVTFMEIDGATIMILASADGPGKETHLTEIEALIGSIEFLD